MTDTLQTPKDFSIDKFKDFSEVFAYNSKYVMSGKVLTLAEDGRKLTYGKLLDLTARFKSWAAANNLKQGDRAIILTQDSLAVITLFMGCLRSGITAVILGPDSGTAELNNLIVAAKPKALFMTPEFFETLDLPPESEAVRLPVQNGASYEKAGFLGKFTGKGKSAPTDKVAFPPAIETAEAPAAPDNPAIPLDTVAYILFTSGTTSRPKGVEITHGNLLAQMKTFVRHYGYTGQSNLLNILPLHHTDGLTQGPVVAFTAGCSVFRPLKFSINAIPQLMDAIYKHRISHFIAVPAMLQLIDSLGNAHHDVFQGNEFKFIISTAGYLDPNLWARFEKDFNVMIVNVYGLTETVCEALYCGLTENTRRIGTIGKPVDTETRICDDDGNDVADGQQGELWVKGPHIMKGYFEMPDETTEVLTNDGWFKTGDLCRKDEDGFYHIVGRKKNVIIVGGINVYPDDIANILRDLPGVMDAVAWGAHDDTWGETVMAAIIPEQGATPDTNMLAEQFLKNAAVEMLPRTIHIVANFPRGPAGKVIVRDLQEMIAAQNEAKTGGGAKAANAALDGKVIALAAKSFKCAEDELTLASTAETTKGWSSLAHVEFLLNLEKEFGIKVEPKDILSVRSIGDALAVVERKKAG